MSWYYWSGDPLTYKRRKGTVTKVDVQPHRVVVVARRDDNGRGEPVWIGGLRLVSAVDQLAELVS